MKEVIAALFDFDGVVIDTETQYSHFWQQIGQEYGYDHLETKVKGQTLTYIYNTFFAGREAEQQEITSRLNRFEQEMTFDYIPGVVEFIHALRREGIATAVVTSSNEQKMNAVYRVLPEVKQLFDHILTAEMFAASKPDPDCYLLGMRMLGSTPATTYVFEDSVNGLKAGMASGAWVIGLATTFPREVVASLAHTVIPDFCGFRVADMLAVDNIKTK